MDAWLKGPLLLAALAAAPAAVAAVDPWKLSPTSLEDCDAVVREHAGEIEAAFCYMRLAYTWPRGRGPVIAHLEGIVAGDPEQAFARFYLATLLSDGGELAPAEREFRAAADLFRRRGHVQGEVGAITGITTLLCADGRFAEAERLLARAERAAAEGGDPDDLSTAEVWAGKCALDESDYGRARVLYEQAQARTEVAPRTWRTGWIVQNLLDGLAGAYAATGEHRRAFETWQELVRRLARNPYIQAAARHGVAAEAVRLADEGELAQGQADALVREALDAEVRAGVHLWISGGEYYTRLLLGARLGPTAEGISELEKALAAGRKDDDRRLICAALRLLGRYEVERDPAALQRGLDRVSESIDLARRSGSRLDAAEGLLERAHLLWGAGRRAEAWEAASAALDEFDRLRDLQPDEAVRVGAGSEWALAYALVAGTLLDPRWSEVSAADVARSFQVMERLRARVLREALAARGEAPQGPAELVLGRRDVLAAIARKQRQLLSPGLAAPERDAALERLEGLEREERRLADALARARGGGALPELAAPALEEVQRALAPDEALLLFQSWRRAEGVAPYRGGSSWVLAVTRESARPSRIPDADVLEQQVRLLAAALERRDGAEAPGAARLYRDLLAGALRDLPPRVTKLALVPDGPLHRLPVEVLREAPGAPPLAARFEISYAPSAALLLRWRSAAPAPASAAALVLADPTPRGPAAQQRGEPFRAPAELGALPFAREEGAAIVRRLGRRSRLLVGEEASERAIKTADLRAYGLLHFGAHAVIDDERPGRSAVVLAPGAPDEDGLLQARDVAGLDLEGRLAVLATCQSAAGAELRGEGVMSLARAFFQAGAHAVVGTRWPVRDGEAAAMMDAFYRGLDEGKTVGQSMAAAQRERMAAGAPAAAWASLSVFGNARLAPVGSGRPRREPAILAAAVAAAAIALVGAARALGRSRRGRRDVC